jgi:predicted DNA-binding mobile mystery protein A
MKPAHKRIIVEQLDETLSRFKNVQGVSPPPKGWIRAIREALGMTGKQLAERLNVRQPRIPILEKDEISGAVSMRTMRQAAEALDCVFVYALVPRSTLENTIREQVRQIAIERMKRTTHTMILEDQQLQELERQKMLQSMTDDLVREMPKDLWSAKS